MLGIYIPVFSQNNQQVLQQTSSTDSLFKIRQAFWDSLPKPTGWMNDLEDLFTPEEQTYIDSLIQGFEKETSIEIAIVTIDTMFVAKENFDKLSLHISNTWCIGKNDKHNGILIALSRGYRKIRIENGYGIEKKMTDQETKEIIDADFIPHFRKANYFEGMIAGLYAIMNKLKVIIVE